MGPVPALHGAMNVTVIHNPAAGAETVSADELCDALRAAGHEPSYASTLDHGWIDAVQEADDVVLAAGGDGTVTSVARLLIGRPVALAVLPLGTANNIAEALHVRCHWSELVRDFGTWRRVGFDVGIASGPWGERPFLEGAGFGLFADTMARVHATATGAADATQGSGLVDDVRRVHTMLACVAPRQCTIELNDDRIVTDAIVLAIMNAPSVGPRLRFSDDVRADDGLLHVIVARESDRAALDAYLRTRMAGARASLQLERHAVRSVGVEWHGGTAHIDDEVVTADGPRISMRAAVRPGAVQVLTPQRGDSERRG
jgi:diacylglycerol kinase (ATP)